MNTRNTVTALRFTNLKRFDSALLVLDTLSNPVTFSLLEFLNTQKTATQLDLLMHTGAGFEELETILESLCFAKIIKLKSDLFSNNYQLNKVRLESIATTLLTFNLV